MFQDHSWELAEESPDWYREVDWRGTYPGPPLYVCFDHAGPRVGWRWWDKYGNDCEVNWLDPEPERGSSDFEIYKEDWIAICTTPISAAITCHLQKMNTSRCAVSYAMMWKVNRTLMWRTASSL